MEGGERWGLVGMHIHNHCKREWAGAVLQAAAPNNVEPLRNSRLDYFICVSVRRAVVELLAEYRAAVMV